MTKVSFNGFWPEFNPRQHTAFNWIFDLFGVEIVDKDPDIIIFGTWGNPSLTPDNVVKVSFTGEQTIPDMQTYDFAFSFEHMDHPNHFRFPLYLWNHNDYFSLNNRDVKDWASEKMKFCNFLYGNNNQSLEGVNARNNFFLMLNRYKKVDSGGGVLNNLGYRVSDKMEFLKDYKFTISFENTVSPGYVTEKLIDPFLSGSLPIYRGSTTVGDDFNKGSFINALDFNNAESLIEKIIEIDNNDEMYNHIMNSSILHNPLPDWTTKEWYISCWERILKYIK